MGDIIKKDTFSLKKIIPYRIRKPISNCINKSNYAMFCINFAKMLFARNTTYAAPILTPSKSSKPTVLIILDHWFLGRQSGSRRVVESQIDFFKSEGYNVHGCFVYPAQNNHRNPGELCDVIDFNLDAAFELGLSFRGLNIFKFWRCLFPAHDIKFRCGMDMILSHSEALQIPKPLNDFNTSSPYKTILCNCVWHMPLAKNISNNKCPILVETHDIQSRQLALSQNRKVKKSDEQSEIQMLDQADNVIALNSEEFNYFKSSLKKARTSLVYPTIMDSNEHSTENPKYDVFFAGTHHMPNYFGLKWFLSEIKPHLPGVKICIAGSIGKVFTDRGLEHLLHQPNVHYAGIVDDINSYYSNSKISIIPILDGHGISIKTIEALGHGKAIVSTAAGIRGFPPTVNLLVSDDPIVFAEMIQSLLSDSEKCISNAHNSKKIFDTHFSPNANKKSYKKILIDCGVS